MLDKYFGLTDAQMRDPRYFCVEFFVETESCVHCQFGDEAEMMFSCEVCGKDGAKTWGWRGQCIRCMGMATQPFCVIETKELVLPPF